jgi:excisionase family DNA binding protein
MPLINVIPGEKIPTAPLNTRLPVWRIPGWLLAVVWLVRGIFRSIVLAVRYWWITGPAAAAWWTAETYGWPMLLGAVLALAAVCVGWWRLHPSSWLRFGWYQAVARCRRLWIYRRGWTRTTPRFVRRLVAERRIAYVKVGRLVRFEEGAVTAYIDAHRVVPINRAEVSLILRRAA